MVVYAFLLIQLCRVSMLDLVASGSAVSSLLFDASCSYRHLQIGRVVADANGLAQMWVK